MKNIVTMRRVLFVIWGLVMYSVSCSKEPIVLSSPPDCEYIAVFGDIQFLTELNSRVKFYQESIDWIKFQHESGLSFKCILQTGDITQSNDVKQYERFWNATKEIAAIIPYYAIIGDHDYKWEPKINSRDSTSFSSFLCFPKTLEHVVDFFEEGRMENVVYSNEIFGNRLDIIALEFGPRDEVIEWADAYVKSHPDRKYVLMTHEYLESGGERRIENLKCVMRLRESTYNTPNQIWDKLVKCNNNIVCVLCGHVGSLYAVTYESNEFGRMVPQIQHNIQGPDYRYDYWLMLWRFIKDSDSVSVSIINTNTGEFYKDSVLFRFRYNY